MTRMPQLTKGTICSFVGQKNFSKGLQAIGNGALVDPAQQGMTLKAYCYGSLPEPYRVQISCDDSSITTAFCSCSADTVIKGKQACEHVATLLLSWYRQPETFTHMDDLETILERQSKAQLLTLIKQLLQQQPEVEWEFTMPPLSGYKSVPTSIGTRLMQLFNRLDASGMRFMGLRLISIRSRRLPPTSRKSGTMPMPLCSMKWLPRQH